MKLLNLRIFLLVLILGLNSCSKSETAKLAEAIDYFPLSKIVYRVSGCDHFAEYVFEINDNQIQVKKISRNITETSEKIIISSSLKNRLNKLIHKFLTRNETMWSTNKSKLVLYDLNGKEILKDVDNSGGLSISYLDQLSNLAEELIKN